MRINSKCSGQEKVCQTAYQPARIDCHRYPALFADMPHNLSRTILPSLLALCVCCVRHSHSIPCTCVGQPPICSENRRRLICRFSLSLRSPAKYNRNRDVSMYAYHTYSTLDIHSVPVPRRSLCLSIQIGGRDQGLAESARRIYLQHGSGGRRRRFKFELTIVRVSLRDQELCHCMPSQAS